VWEHIVVSDGFDSEVESICDYYGVQFRYVTRDENQGLSNGHFAKDVGISLATGNYLVLWDDDNFYFDNALEVLHETARGHDIGVCKATYYKKHRSEEYPDIFFELPQNWTGEFILGDIDTINVCVSTKLAKTVNWSDTKAYEGDYIWLKELSKKDISINYSSNVIGLKL
jgi:glycosyltransferase involved in cell wall biosynthesis